MKAPIRQAKGGGAIELIEEAVHLLRSAPITVLAPWLVGTLPFILALLYFWSDMSGGTLGARRLAEASLGMGVMFVWMKFWHALFAIKLRSLAANQEAPSLTTRSYLNLLATQAVIQPFGLFLIPLAGVAVLPIPWVYAFFQNVTAAGGERGMRETIAAAARFASDYWVQNLRLLLLMAGFSLFVFLNWLTAGLFLPDLIRTLSGLQSHLALNTLALLNSTFIAVVCSLTFICVDPILKTIYVLRCFRSESVHSGEDLVAELRKLRANNSLVAVVIGALLCFSALEAGATPSATPTQGAGSNVVSAVNPGQLEQAIEKVLDQSKYSWRKPREKVEEGQEGIITRFLRDAGRACARAFKAVMEWLYEVLRKLFHPRNRAGRGSDLGWMYSSQVLLWALLAVVAAVLVVALMRWQRSRRVDNLVQAVPLQPVPNLNDENVGPEQLPEDGWLRLGRELLAKGEYRLALRAFYLSNLALLAERQFITLAKCKSNRDYERELMRRAHGLPALLEGFSDNVSVFERAWYGRLEVDEPSVRQFADTVQQMRVTA